MTFTFRPRKDKKDVISFLEAQGNRNDALCYLIEKEIAENGMRDLSKIVPLKRDNSYFRSSLPSARDVAVEVSSKASYKEVNTTSYEEQEPLEDEKVPDIKLPSCYSDE